MSENHANLCRVNTSVPASTCCTLLHPAAPPLTLITSVSSLPHSGRPFPVSSVVQEMDGPAADWWRCFSGDCLYVGFINVIAFCRDNILVLDVFFEALNYETIEQKKAYEVAGLLGRFHSVLPFIFQPWIKWMLDTAMWLFNLTLWLLGKRLPLSHGRFQKIMWKLKRNCKFMFLEL